MLKPDFNPFPELITERLRLRRITMEDAPEIYFLRSDPSVLKYLGKEPATSIKEAEEFIKNINEGIENNNAIIWAIVLAEYPSKVIGTICYWRMLKEHYRAELGYVLNPEYWGKGIMKEAIRKVLEYGFATLEIHSVEARINPGNIASSAVLEATGFIREAYYKEDYFYKGKFEDTAVYSRLQ
ncbi:MAG: GNAT family N-acetyltransferase [Chitinophagaceae bacterium]